MLMSLVDQPSYMMHLARETWYPPIADVMPINRYKNLDIIYILATIVKLMKSKLYKIQPVIDHVRNNCCTIKQEIENSIKHETENSIKHEIENSIDEQIIPAKTKYSGIRQYNPN